jgi:hypothetical protein
MADNQLELKYKENKEEILKLMKNKDYIDCLVFYPDTQPGKGKSDAVDLWGYQTKNLLPQLWWPIKTLRIHPTGKDSHSHWRFSVLTADNKRTFFNEHSAYLKKPFGQIRIGPGVDNYEKSWDKETGEEWSIQFDLELNPEKQFTLRDFVLALLDPKAYEPDGVKENGAFCWYKFAGFDKGTPKGCRFWVQACVRQFWIQGFLKNDPAAKLTEYNKKTGWETPDFPRGTWFTERPAGIELDDGPTSEKAREEATARDNGFPDFI